MNRSIGRFFNNAIIGVSLCIVGISLLEDYKQSSQIKNLKLKQAEYDRTLLDKSQRHQNPTTKPQKNEQYGSAQSTDGLISMTTELLNKTVSRMSSSQRALPYGWKKQNGSIYTFSAMSVDQNHYFANSYLVGHVPFQTQSVWEPLLVLSMRKHYMFDHKLYGPMMQDVWQNSRQAYMHSHGDCEDHALILADWLIGQGYDARVALGKIPSGGHAWVVLFLNSREYVLEATTKHRPRSINDFKLARYATDYRPEFQFNRTQFWENTGSSYTTNYNDKKWMMQSQFVRAN